MATSAPRVSVLMSCYNAQKYLAPAIESILQQTYTGFEFLIADDKSTDDTLKIIERYAKKDPRIRVIKNATNLKLTKTLNKLLGIAKGEYIARMDADDECLPGRFSAQVRYLDTHKDIGVVGTRGVIINSKGNKIGKLDYAIKDAAIRKEMVRRSQFAHPSVMFRRRIIEDVGVYDPSFQNAQDYEFFARILTRYKGANLSQRFLRYRWDLEQNEGFTNSKRQERNALRARWRMLARYGWPVCDVHHLVKPVMSYCIPATIKKRLLRKGV